MKFTSELWLSVAQIKRLEKCKTVPVTRDGKKFYIRSKASKMMVPAHVNRKLNRIEKLEAELKRLKTKVKGKRTYAHTNIPCAYPHCQKVCKNPVGMRLHEKLVHEKSMVSGFTKFNLRRKAEKRESQAVS